MKFVKKPKIRNGYRWLYLPSYDLVDSTDNGWIKEHIYVLTQRLGRKLKKDEVVHHLDGNKLNNMNSNLIVMLNTEHIRLHKWIDYGKEYYGKINNSLCRDNGKRKNMLYCINCDFILHTHQFKYCSKECEIEYRRNKRPSKEKLIKVIQYNNIKEISKMFDVSRSTVQTWLKEYQIKDLFYKYHPSLDRNNIPTREELKELFLLGFSPKEIASKLHRSRHTVYQWIKDKNLQKWKKNLKKSRNN